MASASEIYEIGLPLEVVTKSSGLAIDIGGSLAKIVYRCKDMYKDGKPLDPSKHKDGNGYMKVVTFPREEHDTYIKFIADHADLTGHHPTVNITGLGGADYKDKVESRLNIKLNIISEFHCMSNAIRSIISGAALVEPFHALDEKGIVEGKMLFHKGITFQFMADGEIVPDQTCFEKVMDEALLKMETLSKEPIRLPCLVLMSGSAFAPMILKKDGRFDCIEIDWFGGRAFLGLASLLTGDRDWKHITEMLDSHDGSTAYSYRDLSADSASIQHDNGNKSDDPYATTEGMKFFPFGNANVSPRKSIKDGDILYTLLEMVAVKAGTLAYNVALAQDVNQVLICGSFTNLSLARAIITREIIWRNIGAYYRKRPNKMVDFRFIQNGGHLVALGALLHNHAV